jgi:hypothetical protein
MTLKAASNFKAFKNLFFANTDKIPKFSTKQY